MQNLSKVFIVSEAIKCFNYLISSPVFSLSLTSAVLYDLYGWFSRIRILWVFLNIPLLINLSLTFLRSLFSRYISIVLNLRHQTWQNILNFFSSCGNCHYVQKLFWHWRVLLLTAISFLLVIPFCLKASAIVTFLGHFLRCFHRPY